MSDPTKVHPTPGALALAGAPRVLWLVDRIIGEVRHEPAHFAGRVFSDATEARGEVSALLARVAELEAVVSAYVRLSREVHTLLNAETLAGMQAALRAAESELAQLKRSSWYLDCKAAEAALAALLADLREAEGDAERTLLPFSPDCRACTRGVSPNDVPCARHRAEALLRGKP